MVDLGARVEVEDDEASTRPVDARRSRRREELLDAAIDAIRTLGPAATMEQLANAGGVTKPILYRHFVDRDGLIEAIAGRFSGALMGSLGSALHVEQDARAILVGTVEAYVAFLEDDPHLYGFLAQQPNPRSDHRSPIGPLVDLVAPQIAEVTRVRLEEAGQDPTCALPWAYGMVGLVHQATQWWLRDRPMPRQEFVAHLTDLLWGGVSASVGSPR
ncbi:MAG: TetR family transcriptional regulator [Acidimicrobiia bacterium]